MPRIRSVHPDICVSDTMASLPAHLERTFVRLWTHCDDEGRCEDRPKLIKAGIYPLHDDITPESLDQELGELTNRGLVRRYYANGTRLLQVVSWSEYQHPQKKRDSKWPPPAETDDSDTPPVDLRERSRTSKGLEREMGEGDRSTENGVPVGADAILREVLESGKKYPDRFKGHLGREVKSLLTEGFSREQVTAAAKSCVVKGLSPGTLPSLVVQVSGNGARAAGDEWIPEL